MDYATYFTLPRHADETKNTKCLIEIISFAALSRMRIKKVQSSYVNYGRVCTIAEY